MADVIVIKGAVRFGITLDPSVWIFDDRKFDLRTYRPDGEDADKEQSAYLQGTGAQWDKELQEGATPPSEQRSLLQVRKVLDGDYAIKLEPFLENAEPLPEATLLRIHRENKETITLPLERAKRAILQFAKDGKPIRERGPVLFYLPEQVNGEPIDSITAFELAAE
ncbi:hypothetical protein [Brevibacillus massiliensis]|uniref:hypothetical protein n=1 Tax=Brevibacillus massiliensis TaxID=1118054 RepID=UPI0002D7FFD4|nr:hypothetical protein [Brevibacillus massiliensis]